MKRLILVAALLTTGCTAMLKFGHDPVSINAPAATPTPVVK